MGQKIEVLGMLNRSDCEVKGHKGGTWSHCVIMTRSRNHHDLFSGAMSRTITKARRIA